MWHRCNTIMQAFSHFGVAIYSNCFDGNNKKQRKNVFYPKLNVILFIAEIVD
jgi:acid stress-induced BolA-like protein IbaG/YrbA